MDTDELLTTWVATYADRLVRLAFTYVRDQATAEDRVQEAFIKAYRAWRQFTHGDDPFPWLARIVINECRSFQRRHGRETVTSVPPDPTAASAEETVLGQARDEALHQAVLSLPVKYRLPLVLFYFEELPSREVARILGTTPGTIRTRLHRGRDRLRQLLKEDEPHGTGVTRRETGV